MHALTYRKEWPAQNGKLNTLAKVIHTTVIRSIPEQGALDGDARGCSVELNARIHAWMQHNDHRILHVCVNMLKLLNKLL